LTRPIPKRSVTIALLNKKGGVGKTSTCFHLAGSLARQGRRVLLIDNDPQGSLSRGFYGTATVEILPREQTLAALYDEPLAASPETLIARTRFANIDLVPTSHLFDPYNVNPPHSSPYSFETLRHFIAATRGYDYVLIDSPPNLYFCSWSALLAADYIIVPVQTEDFGIQGLVDVQGVIDEARPYNPGMRILGYLITMFDRRRATHRDYAADLRAAFPDDVFEQVIPDSATFTASLVHRQPVSFYRPKSPAARALAALTEEIERRIAADTTALETLEIVHG
jgi:chromosome partitioning protein